MVASGYDILINEWIKQRLSHYILMRDNVVLTVSFVYKVNNNFQAREKEEN